MTPVDFMLFGLACLGCALVGYLAGLEDGKKIVKKEIEKAEEEA